MSQGTILEDDVIADSEPEELAAATSTVEPRTRRRRTRAVQIVGLALIVVLAGALIVSRVQLSNLQSVDNQRATALAAARAYTGDVATYSYAHLQKDFGRVEAESTPSFRRSFIASSTSLAKVLRQYKATATAKVVSAGLVSMTSSRAVVLLFVDQTVANSAQSTNSPTKDNSRVQVTLVQSGGRWLLNDLKLL